MICVHLRPVPTARAWPSVVKIYEWYNPITKNRTQMNADYLGKKRTWKSVESVSQQKTENRESGKEKPRR